MTLVLGLSTACSQLIGLGDYEKVDEASGGSSGSHDGSGGATVGSGGKTGSPDAGGAAGEPVTGGSSNVAGADTRGGTGPNSGGTAGGGPVSAGATNEPEGGAGGSANGGSAEGGANGGHESGGTLSGGSSSGGRSSGGTSAGGTSACTTHTVDLFADNGTFEGGAIPIAISSDVDSGWYQGVDQADDDTADTVVVENRTTLAATYGVTPHDGSHAANLGGDGTKTFSNDFVGRYSWVGRRVDIPAGTRALTFECWIQMQSEEGTETDYDYLDIWLWDEVSNKNVFLFDELSNLDTPNYLTWKKLTVAVPVDEVSNFAGQSYSAELFALADDTAPTYFFVDTCSLKATYCD